MRRASAANNKLKTLKRSSSKDELGARLLKSRGVAAPSMQERWETNTNTLLSTIVSRNTVVDPIAILKKKKMMTRSVGAGALFVNSR